MPFEIRSNLVIQDNEPLSPCAFSLFESSYNWVIILSYDNDDKVGLMMENKYVGLLMMTCTILSSSFFFVCLFIYLVNFDHKI